jgi:hemerythrin-like domain-containing protein
MDGPTKPDLRIGYLEHRSMRADAARLVELVSAAQPTDAGRLRALAAWYGRYEDAIHDHHHAEEAVIYPALLERDPSFAEADGQLEGQHQVLADRLQVARESLTGLIGATGGGRWEPEQEEAAKAVVALKAIVDTHTRNEEAVAFPRYAAHFSAAEYADLNKAAFKLVGVRSFVFAGPWVLDHATPGERAQLLGEQPLLLRVLYRLALRPRYQRLVRPLGPASQPARP